MKTKTIELPIHAIRYLNELCKIRREVLAMNMSFSLQLEAEYDSLNAIESALPDLEE